MPIQFLVDSEVTSSMCPRRASPAVRLDRLSLHDVNGVFVGRVRPPIVRFLRLCGLRG
jgi:hypothetical protein